jgi:hypothetical protein
VRLAVVLPTTEFAGFDSQTPTQAMPVELDRLVIHDRVFLIEGPGLLGRKAIVIYGFDYPAWPMDPVIEAFEMLARTRVSLVRRAEAAYADLVHRV